MERGSGQYCELTRQIWRRRKMSAFVDLTDLVADRYEQMGADTVKPLFPRDHTHTSEEGAELNAKSCSPG